MAPETLARSSRRLSRGSAAAHTPTRCDRFQQVASVCVARVMNQPRGTNTKPRLRNILKLFRSSVAQRHVPSQTPVRPGRGNCRNPRRKDWGEGGVPDHLGYFLMIMSEL